MDESRTTVEAEKICSGAAVHIDWPVNVVRLVKAAAEGSREEKLGVMQFNLPKGGRRVEIQLVITDNQDEFTL